jgi:hypothetical protein
MGYVYSNADGEMALAKSAPVFSLHARALPLDTASNKVLTWAIGALLGVLTVTTDYVATPRDLFSRVAPVDFLCLAFLGMLFFHHRMKVPPLRSAVYAASIVISLIPGLLVTGGDVSHVWTGASALFMAFGYYLIGLNVAGSPALMRSLLGGLCVGVALQSIIVAHDTVVSQAAQWFRDPMDGRVRGSFKTNGQLGAYSFCAAGLLLTYGTTMGTRNFRRICTVLGLIATTFVFMASRRMGMLCMGLWGFLFAFRAWRFSKEKPAYKYFVGLFFCIVVAIIVKWPDLQDTFIGERFSSAVEGATSEDGGFIGHQFHAIMNHANRWFPWGLGVGQGAEVNPEIRQEVHNGMLAVLVEMGVIGLLGFFGMMILPLTKRQWHKRSRDHEWLGLLMTTFIIISFVFIVHNTLARDRVYLLYLGIATTICLQESRLNKPSVYFPEKEEA